MRLSRSTWTENNVEESEKTRSGMYFSNSDRALSSQNVHGEIQISDFTIELFKLFLGTQNFQMYFYSVHLIKMICIYYLLLVLLNLRTEMVQQAIEKYTNTLI